MHTDSVYDEPQVQHVMAEEYVTLTTDNLDACAQLYVEVFNGEPWNDHWTTDTARKRLLDLISTPGFVGIVAVQGQPIGFAAGHCEQWQERITFCLTEMCVRKDLQRKGVGTRILHRLENALMVSAGASSLYLLTMRGGEAEAFYSKNGYRTNERMILMSRRLEIIDSDGGEPSE